MGENRLIHLQRFDIFSYIKIKRAFPGGSKKIVFKKEQGQASLVAQW